MNHSSKQIFFFFNVLFPIPLAQGMLWTSLPNPQCIQMMPAHLTWMQARGRVFLSFPVQLLLPSHKEQESPVTLSGEPWLFPVNVQANHHTLGPQVPEHERLFWNTSWGSNPAPFSPLGDILPLGGVFNQQHQWQNERTCYSPVQGGVFPFFMRSRKPSKLIRNHTKQDLYAA